MDRKSSFRHPLLFAVFSLLGIVLAPSFASADAVTGIFATGHGEVRVRPDSLRVTVGIEAQAATVEEVQTQANEKMTRVLNTMHGLEIPNLKMQTSIITIRPDYETTAAGVRTSKIVGYTAENAVSIEVRKAPFDQIAGFVSTIMNTALKSGANVTNDFEFFLDDPSKAYEEALDKAVKEARSKGDVMAKAAGVTITGVGLVRESGARMPVFEMDGAGLMGAAGVAGGALGTPVEAGEITVRTDVTVWLTVH